MELKVVTFNSASLVSHAQRATTQELVDSLKADFFCVSETHLKSRHNVNFTGYNIIRDDTNSGSALLVRKDYAFEEVSIKNLQTCSAAAALVKTNDNRRILIAAVYIKCNSPSEQLGQDLQILSDLQSKSKYLIFGGDFNSRHTSWGDLAKNRNGVALEKWIHNQSPLNQLEMILPDTPTRPASQSILDYFLMSADATLTLQVLTCKTLPGMSDHFAVELILSLNSQLQKRVPSAIRSFAHTN